MTSIDGKKKPKTRKHYERPTLRKLPTEEAKQKLRALVSKGDQEAKKLLEKIARAEAEDDSGNEKQSA